MLSSKAPERRIFQFRELQNFQVTNSYFINNQNIIIFELLGYKQTSLFDKIPLTSILCDNLTVFRNAVSLDRSDQSYISLFNFANPLLKTTVMVTNSNFTENQAGNRTNLYYRLTIT